MAQIRRILRWTIRLSRYGSSKTRIRKFKLRNFQSSIDGSAAVHRQIVQKFSMERRGTIDTFVQISKQKEAPSIGIGPWAVSAETVTATLAPSARKRSFFDRDRTQSRIDRDGDRSKKTKPQLEPIIHYSIRSKRAYNGDQNQEHVEQKSRTCGAKIKNMWSKNQEHVEIKRAYNGPRDIKIEWDPEIDTIFIFVRFREDWYTGSAGLAILCQSQIGEKE